jgi:hypothetical protein
MGAVEDRRPAGRPGRAARGPGEWPEESFDLIMLSEIRYYFDDADLEQVLVLGIKTLNPGGHLLAVHWPALCP